MPAFLAPLLSKFGGYALVALAVAIGLAVVYGKGRADEATACKAAQAEAVIAAQKQADMLANQLVAAEAKARDATAKVVTVYQDRIVHAPQTSSCGPVLRDAVAGLQQLFSAGGAQGK